MSLSASCDSAGRCYPGCQCPSGTLLSTADDDQQPFDHHVQSDVTASLVCVAVDDCPCRYQGRSYPPGTVVEVNCNTWYANFLYLRVVMVVL